MRDAMLAGVTLNIFNNHCDRVRMANLAQMVNVLQSVILTNKQKIILTPTYHVMEMYNVHQDATMIPLTLQIYFIRRVKTVCLPFLFPLPGTSRELPILSLVNIDPGKTNACPVFEGFRESGWKMGDNGRILQSARIQDYNSFDEPEKI